MDIKIKETGEIKTLEARNESNIEYTADLIGNSSFWLEYDGEYDVMTQADFDWWQQYIIDTEKTQSDVEDLADEIGMTISEINEIVGEWQAGDYDDHRKQALAAMDYIRETV